MQIRREIEVFVTVWEADGVTVTVWEHDSFVQAVRGRYLKEPEDVKAVHSLLADYFLGTWSDRPKPVHSPDGSSHCLAQFNRLVPSQPLTFPAYGNETHVGRLSVAQSQGAPVPDKPYAFCGRKASRKREKRRKKCCMVSRKGRFRPYG